MIAICNDDSFVNSESSRSDSCGEHRGERIVHLTPALGVYSGPWDVQAGVFGVAGSEPRGIMSKHGVCPLVEQFLRR